jgi:hypothetical protein
MTDATKIAEADAALDEAIAASERQFGKADADDIAHHAQIVADQMDIAFRIDGEGNVEWLQK